jgi:hypothetical protein
VKQQPYIEVKENVPVDRAGRSVSFRKRETKSCEKKKSQRKQAEEIVSDTVREVRDTDNHNNDLLDYAKACGNVMFMEDVFVPAQSQVVCMANFQGKSQVKAEHLVIEPSDDIPQGLFLSRSLCKRNDAIPIRLMNITTEPLLLQRKRVIANAYEAEVMTKPEFMSTSVRKISTEDTRSILEQLNLITDLSKDEERLKKLILEYIDIFRSPNQKLTCTSKLTHRIITEDVSPICKRPYRVPYQRQEILKKEINKLLDDGVITESESPWSFPAILIEKKAHPGEEAQFRLCIDFRTLNNITKTDFFPLPYLEDTIDRLAGASLFSTMDLASGYFQIPLHPDDQEKTAFSTFDNHYEFKRMPMGLKNAPATWQRFMNHIFANLSYKECLLYLDDVIVFSSDNIEEHLNRLRHVFEKMRESNLKFKPTKCHFLKKEVEYLGHIVTQEGYKPNPNKIEIVKNYPQPKKAKDIRAFLGLAGFYRKFVPNFSKISQPLTELTKNNVVFKWTELQQQAFEVLKHALVTPPILKYPCLNKEFILNTDASGTAIGAILTQKYDGIEHPVCYASRTLNPAERRYSTIERELLAVVWAVKKYRIYLTGVHFTIVTDHRPLKYLLTIKDPSSRLAKWAMFLMEYSFTIEYKPGRMHTNVDTLSRIKTEEEHESKVIATIQHEIQERPAISVIWSKPELAELQRKDAELRDIIDNQLNTSDVF